MPKINLEENDLVRLFEAANDGYEPPEDLIGKLFPSFVEKLRQEGKFDAEALIRHKIPTIEYAGKRPEGVILASASLLGQSAPLQTIRSFGEPGKDGWQNMIVQGDNLQFLKTVFLNKDPLIKDKVKGVVKLIYIDSPFGTGDEYGASNGVMSYSAKQKGAEFIENLRERLIFLREMLAKDGVIFGRIDYHFGHYVRVIMDEIFERSNFKNEMIVNRIYKNVFGDSKFIPNATDSLYVYSKSSRFSYIDVMKPRDVPRSSFWRHMDDSAGIRHPRERKVFNKILYPPDNKHFKYNQTAIEQMILGGRIRLKCENCGYIHDDPNKNWEGCPNCKVDRPKLQYLVKESTHTHLQSTWTDIPGYSNTCNYPTENSEVLLERVIKTSSEEDDIVMDVFAGSGTTAAVAEKLGRRWIMCDFGKHAIYTMQKRMLEIAESKAFDSEKKNAKYGKQPKPFSVVSVGAYDFTRVMNLRKNKDAYISFVLSLFGIPKEEKDFASRYRLDSVYGEKDGDPVEIFPVWDDDYLYSVKVDKDYLKEIIIQSRGRIKGNFYIIVPETCTVISDMTLPNNQGDDIYFKLLKFPYKILEEVARNFAIEEQPDSAQNINNLLSSVGFYFNDEIIVETKKNENGFKLTDFKTMIVNRDGNLYEGLDGLSLVLIDLNYNGKVFKMDKAVYAKEIKDGEIQTEGISGKSAIIAIDKHGNESKPTYIAG